MAVLEQGLSFVDTQVLVVRLDRWFRATSPPLYGGSFVLCAEWSLFLRQLSPTDSDLSIFLCHWPRTVSSIHIYPAPASGHSMFLPWSLVFHQEGLPASRAALARFRPLTVPDSTWQIYTSAMYSLVPAYANNFHVPGSLAAMAVEAFHPSAMSDPSSSLFAACKHLHEFTSKYGDDPDHMDSRALQVSASNDFRVTLVLRSSPHLFSGAVFLGSSCKGLSRPVRRT